MHSQKTSIFSDHPQPQDIRDRILDMLLPDIPFDGWTWKAVESAAVQSGYQASMATAVFPGGLPDVLDHFSDRADRWMMERLQGTDPETLRVRDRVHTAVMMRFRGLYPWRDAVRQAGSFWAMPTRAGRAAKITWRTADRIWRWAGDTATDYNHYTKRALLCGVLASAALAWLDDNSHGMAETDAFLGRRIENVMTIGKAVGKIKSVTPFRKARHQE